MQPGIIRCLSHKEVCFHDFEVMSYALGLDAKNEASAPSNPAPYVR